MAEEVVYNPLDYENLTKNCVKELMERGPYSLPLKTFFGVGVYALFYDGDLPCYASVRSPKADLPIYVGKAVPAGSRKGATTSGPSKKLYERIRDHTQSIKAASGNLKLSDFKCRYLVVTPLWITMAERFLIEHYKPMWNTVIEGFGIHNPGGGRFKGMLPWWDALHPGRAWAPSLEQGRTAEDAQKRIADFLAGKIEPNLEPEEDEEGTKDKD